MDFQDGLLMNLRYPTPEDRKCYKNTDINFKFLSYENDFHFSISNCLVEASMQSAETQCGCVPGALKVSDNQCHGSSLQCFTNSMNMIGTFNANLHLENRRYTNQVGTIALMITVRKKDA